MRDPRPSSLLPRPRPSACTWLLLGLLGACGGSSPGQTVDAAVDPDGGGSPLVDGPAADRAAPPTPQAPTLGLTCGGPCTDRFCVASDPACGGTSLTRPCVGRAAGMYCTRACTSDGDCAGGTRSTVCLTGCPEYPELAGFCWTPADSDYLKREVCPAAAPDAGPPPGDAAVDQSLPPPGDGPAPVNPGGPGVKFCNRVRRNNAAVELTLEIAGQVRLQATSGACAPPLGQACPTIPEGEVPIRLLEGATVLVEDTFDFHAADEYFVIAEADPADSSVFFQAESFPAGARCSATDPLTLPPARTRPGKPAQRSRKSAPAFGIDR